MTLKRYLGSSSSAERGDDASTSAAQAAAAAGAASGMAAAFSATQPMNMAEQASMEATMESVQRQLEFLHVCHIFSFCGTSDRVAVLTRLK